jgi:hypothetical protein
MSHTACLTPDELSAFLQGKLPEATLVALAGHLDGHTDPLAAAYRREALAGPPTSLETPPPGVGAYEILGELGRGGMGVMYKARDLQLRRVVALKMLLGGAFSRDEDRDRFRAEAEAVAMLQHPQIVQIYEVGEHDDGAVLPRPHSTLELAEGGQPGGPTGRPQPPRQAAAWAEARARADHYATSGHRPPRPQAVQRSANHRRHRQAVLLRRGQVPDRLRRQDAERDARGHAGVHGPRAGRG